MRICVNALSVVTGGGLVNLSALLRALATEDRANDYLVLAPAERAEAFETGTPNFRLQALKRPPGGVLARVLWEQARLPRLVECEGIDLLFSPANVAPLRLPGRCRSVVKVQNIAPFSEVAMALEPGARGRTRLRALRWLTLRSLARADAAIFISAASAALLGDRVRRHEVIYDGLTRAGVMEGDDPHPCPLPKREGAIVLCVADFYPYKNIETLVRGFGLLPGEVRRGVELVVVGRPLVPSYARQIRGEIERWGLSGAVRVIEGLPHGELLPLYRKAAVYAFPSRVEAGGTTLVEAMAAGAPVVASSVEPMPEFCGDAALYCNPDRPGEWASALKRALTNAGLAGTLGEAGRARAAGFRWAEAARRTLALFEAVMSG